MPIHAFVSSVGTLPEPSVLSVLDRVDKVFAHFVRRRLGITMLRHDYLSQLLFIPVIHIVLLYFFLLFAFSIPCIGVEVPLFRLSFH